NANCGASRLERPRAVRRSERARGASRVEVVVVLLLVIVAAAVLPAITNTPKGTPRVHSAAAQVQLFESAIATYQMTVRRLPSSLNDLVMAPSDTESRRRWEGPYIKENT